MKIARNVSYQKRKEKLTERKCLRSKTLQWDDFYFLCYQGLSDATDENEGMKLRKILHSASKEARTTKTVLII